MAVNVKNDVFLAEQPQQGAALAWLKDSSAVQSMGPSWMKALCETGYESFAQTGLPTATWEGWQYTNLRSLSETSFHYAHEPVRFDVAALPAPLLQDAGRIVVVNGQYQPQLSHLPTGVEVLSLLQAAEKNIEGLEHHLVSVGDLAQNPFKALNTAYLRDGFVLRVAPKIIIEQPIEVLHYNFGDEKAPAAIYPRMLYVIAENAQVTITERYMGQGVYLSNSYTHVALESAASLKLYRFMQESTAAVHISLTFVQQQKSSHFEGFSMATGGHSVRQEYQLELIDSVISSNIGGIYLLKDRQSHDFTVAINHFEPNGTSVQNFKGVIDDQARAIFQGKIHVSRAAQKTDGKQRHHALLLSDQAEASVKPELEIYADDVKCSHGAATGQLDQAALFYLRSRGIPEDQARALLVESFLNEAVEQVSYTPIQDMYRACIREWLDAKDNRI